MRVIIESTEDVTIVIAPTKTKTNMNGYREQRPTTATNWLYQERAENEREFCKVVCHADGDPDWAECTDAEKVAWEEAHPISEPEPMPENADA